MIIFFLATPFGAISYIAFLIIFYKRLHYLKFTQETLQFLQDKKMKININFKKMFSNNRNIFIICLTILILQIALSTWGAISAPKLGYDTGGMIAVIVFSLLLIYPNTLILLVSFIKNKSTYKQYKKYISTTKEDWENYFLPLNEINSESEDNQLVCKYTNNELKIYKWWSPKIWPEKLPSLTKLKNKISTIKELEKEEFISNLLFSMPRMIGPKRDSLFTREQISYLYHLMCNSVK